MKTEVQAVPMRVLDSVHPSRLIKGKYDIRDEKSRKESVQSLAKSIQEHGLKNELLVTPKGKDEKGLPTYLILDGNQRDDALKLIHWTKIPIAIVRGSDEELTKHAFANNLMSESYNPIEEAKAFKLLSGWLSTRQIEDYLGGRKDHTVIARSLEMLKLLVPEVQDMVSDGSLTPSNAETLFHVKKSQQLELAKQIMNEQRETARAFVQLHQELLDKGAKDLVSKHGIKVSEIVKAHKEDPKLNSRKELKKALKQHVSGKVPLSSRGPPKPETTREKVPKMTPFEFSDDPVGHLTEGLTKEDVDEVAQKFKDGPPEQQNILANQEEETKVLKIRGMPDMVLFNELDAFLKSLDFVCLTEDCHAAVKLAAIKCSKCHLVGGVKAMYPEEDQEKIADKLEKMSKVAREGHAPKIAASA